MRPVKWITSLAILLGLCAGASAWAHELQSNRIQVVVREPNHVQLHMWLDLVALMHHADAPAEADAMVWLAQHASMPTLQFQKIWQQHQTRLEKALLIRASGQPIALTRWAWPDAANVQQAIRSMVMQKTMAPGEHMHPNVMEVQAQARAAGAVSDLWVQAPPAWQPVLVTAYRPQQQWLQNGANAVRFDLHLPTAR